jgi:hypothetical protein
MVVKDWSLGFWPCCMLLSQKCIQYFIPTLVKSFGWGNWEGQCKLKFPSSIHSNYNSHYVSPPDHTIPPYACAVVFILLVSFIADYFKNKSYFFLFICRDRGRVLHYRVCEQQYCPLLVSLPCSHPYLMTMYSFLTYRYLHHVCICLYLWNLAFSADVGCEREASCGYWTCECAR